MNININDREQHNINKLDIKLPMKIQRTMMAKIESMIVFEYLVHHSVTFLLSVCLFFAAKHCEKGELLAILLFYVCIFQSEEL